MDSASPQPCDVLHVTAGAAPSVERMNARFARRGLRVRSVGDPYRALAGLQAADPPGAVVACVDYFAAGEFEFFDILRRTHPDINVFAYGDERCRHKVERAVQSGAGADVTDAALPPPRERAPADTQHASPRARARSPRARVKTPRAKRPAAARTAAPPTPAVSDDSHLSLTERVSERAGDAAPPPRAGVPWKKDHRRPARVPPAPAQPGGNPPPDHAASRRSAVDEPLLTEDELRALVGPEEEGPGALGPDGDAST